MGRPARRNDRLLAVYQKVDRRSGLIDRPTIFDVGATQADLRSWLEAGLFNQASRGIYHSAALPWTFATNLDLGSRTAGGQGGLSCSSALYAHGFEGIRPGSVHVVIPRGVSRHVAGRLHESTDLRPSDIVTVKGFRATTVERSLLDAARHLTPSSLGDLVDYAIRKELVSIEGLSARFLEVGRRGRPGTVTMRECLAERTDIVGPESNFYESLFDQVLEMGGFPPAVKQYRVDVNGRVYYLDRAWPDHQTWAECDSMLAHSTARQLNGDLRRQNDIINETTMMPMRFSYQQVTKDPWSVVESLSQRLPRGTARMRRRW